MRPGTGWLAAACSSLLIACTYRPLPPAEEIPVGMDAGTDVGAPDVGGPRDAGVPPGVLDWAVPIGSQPLAMAAGSTTVKAVVAT
jgi:hypothetical protein